MLTALGRRGSRGALAALARAARGGEVRPTLFLNQSDRRRVFFFFFFFPHRFASLLRLFPGLSASFSATICRDDEVAGVSGAREDQTVAGREREFRAGDGIETRAKTEAATTTTTAVEGKKKMLSLQLISRRALFAGSLFLFVPASCGFRCLCSPSPAAQ